MGEPGPVRIRQGGTWVPVDLNLRTNADGSVAPSAHPHGLTLSGARSGSTGEVAGVRAAGGRIAMGWNGKLPEPALDGPRATYAEVKPGVDLVIEATRAGFEQFLVLKSRAAADQVKSLSLPVTGPVASHVRDEDGGLTLKDSKGRVVATSPAPEMWDAQIGPDGQTPRRRAVVASTVGKQPARAASAGRAAQPAGVQLRLTPDEAWLNDPATVYPVVVDPQINVSTTFDTYVKEGDTVGRGGANDLQLGITTGDRKKARSFVHWDTAALRGKQVTSASASFYSFYSTTCSATSWEIWSTGAASDATRWGSQPQWLTREATSTQTKGFSSSCNDGWVSVTATSFFQRAAANNQTRAYMGIRATNEGDTNGWKQFRSRNAADNAQVPKAVVTYNSYPAVGTRSTVPSTACATGANRPFIASKTPQLRAVVSDPEGAKVDAEVEWSTTAGAGVRTLRSGKVASGSTISAPIPAGALTEGGSYRWRVRGNDGTGTSAWSSYCEFTVDTTAPGTAPSVSSTAYPADRWGGGAGVAGSFTFGAAGTADAASYEYGLDVDPPTQLVNATGVGGAATVSVTPTSDGPHTLNVRSRDRAGNRSPIRRYTFLVGSGAVTTPQPGDISAGMTALTGIGQASATGITYQWRRGDADAWTAVPTTDATLAEGGAPANWPVPTTGNGAFPKINWDVGKTANDAEPGPDALNGPFQVRAVFVGAAASGAVKFTLDRDRASAATTEVGPGSVNALTGNFAVAESDVLIEGAGPDLSLSRTYNTRQAGGTDAMFGPGWVSSVGAEDGTFAYTGLTVTGSLVQVGLADGGTVGFVRRTATSTGATFEAQQGAADLTLTYTAAGDRYTLRNADGVVVTFTRPADAPAGRYVATVLDGVGSADSSTISWEKATVDGVATVRPTRLLAPVPAGVTCTGALVKGCRVLTFSYATATTTGTDPAQWGDYAGRLTQVSMTAFDPARNAMVTVPMARYAYDRAGRLRSSWDPRLDHGGDRHLADTYGYDGDGVLAEIRPAGQEPWQLAYTTVPGDPGKGRLRAVTRSALSAGTATTTVVYRVPVAGAGAPYDMSAAHTNRWGQREQPVEAVAVFRPDQVPNGDQPAGRLPDSYERATVVYVDANGREVNTVVPGGHTTATWYDQWGNTVRTMTPGNIRRALDASDTDTAQQEAQEALTLSTVDVYSADGLALRETFGPEHDVALPGTGTTVRGRKHVVTRYDEGAPAAEDPFLLPTTEITSVSYEDNGERKDADARTVKRAYDWSLGVPTVVTTDPDGLALTTRLSYDSQSGEPLTSTNARGGSSVTTPSTRRTVYYRSGTGSGHAECDNQPQWADLVCREQPGGQPDSGPQLPAEITTYDLYGQRAKVVEKVAEKVLRTTTMRYDAAGRIGEVAVTAADGFGEHVPAQRNVYDPATGNPLRTETVDDAGAVTARVVRAFDTLGRQTSYTDADGNTSTTTYDLLGRPATTNDGKTTRTFSYDDGTERRGVLTGVQDSLGNGAFAGEYDADGNLVRETRPNGMVVTNGYDESGAQVSVRYDRPGCGQEECGIYYAYADHNAHGQQRLGSSSLSNRASDYDAGGRLRRTAETIGQSCTTRAYELDAASNRTRQTLYAPTADGDCQDTTAAQSRTFSYDSADRITGGYRYDDLGRTLLVPAADTADPAGGNVTVGYHTTDLVRSITHGARTTTYSLDVTGERIRSWTDTADPQVTRRHHYADDSDSPTWTDEGDGTFSAALTGISGAAGTWTAEGIDWQIVNLHGDVVASVRSTEPGLSATFETDEYGVPADPEDVGAHRYGYLGAEQRAADTPSGIMLMGVRLYNTVTGRFLTVDPVYDGSCNRYEYACADPINKTDLDGKAIPAIIVAIAVAARAVYTACRVAKSWCKRALKWLGQRAMKYLRKAWRWMLDRVQYWWGLQRTKNGYKCGMIFADLASRAVGGLLDYKYGSGAARVIGFIGGFAFGYARNFPCSPKNKYS